MRRMNTYGSRVKFPSRAVFYYLTFAMTCVTLVALGQNPINLAVPKAMYLMETDQMTKAISEVQNAITANPMDASLDYYLGYLYLKANDRAKATAAFDKGIQVNDKEPLNYAGKGWVSLLENKVPDAKAQFEKAGIAKTKNVEVLKAVAEAYCINSKYSVDAIGILNRAKSAANTDPDVQILFGDAYLVQSPGNGGPSVTSYERAASIRPTIAKPYYKIGMVFERSKNNESALENFNKAISIDPKYTLAYKELGEVYYLMNDAEKALKPYETYLTLTEKPENAQLTYAFILVLGKNFKKANEVFKKLVDAPDVKVVTLRFYANSLSEDGEFQKSKDVFDKYFAKAKPEDLVAKDYEDYGRTLLKLKQDSLATISFNKCLKINPDQQEVLQLLGDTYYKNKKFALAVDSYQKLIAKRKEPKSLDYFSIGRSYYYNNQFVEADSAFTRLIKMQPEMTVGYIWEANTKSQMDPESDQGLAKPYFEKVIEKGSTNPEKNKKDLISSYRYLGYYYYLKKDYPAAKANYEKLLVLIPGDKDTMDALEILNKPIQQQPEQKPKR